MSNAQPCSTPPTAPTSSEIPLQMALNEVISLQALKAKALKPPPPSPTDACSARCLSVRLAGWIKPNLKVLRRVHYETLFAHISECSACVCVCQCIGAVASLILTGSVLTVSASVGRADKAQHSPGACRLQPVCLHDV